MILDDAAANKSLDNDYGANKGSNAPGSHTLHLFDSDPTVDGVELSTTGGYSAPTVTNNGTNWPAASARQKVGPEVVFPASTAAWSAVATHWALKGSDDLWWDTGELSEPINITAAGVTKKVTPTIYYGSRI